MCIGDGLRFDSELGWRHVFGILFVDVEVLWDERIEGLVRWTRVVLGKSLWCSLILATDDVEEPGIG
jgi:hypothetical protein